MAAPPLMRSLSTRTVKKLEKPRPLKTSISQTKVQSEPLSPGLPVTLKNLMSLVEKVSQSLMEKIYDDTLRANTAVMHSTLKFHGQQLEAIYKDQLDRAFIIFRDGCQDDDLECTTRLQLLELVELRAKQWSSWDTIFTYYSAKMATPELEPIVMTPEVNTSSITVSTPSPPNPPVLGPGEVLKTSGKFPKPMKIPGKNYCKDEVVIRNSDSGKVMGIKGRRVHMIEEISETIVSFQREQHFKALQQWIPSVLMLNPGAKERLVQITGPSEDKIVYARHLMEETIRRNASPVREESEKELIGGSSSSLNSSASDESNRLNQPGSKRPALLHSYSTNDATLGEYKYTVSLGNDCVKITGANFETVRNARLVLEEYYNIWIQKNIIGDCYGIDEDVFIDPVPDIGMMRLNSVDSGNGNGPSTSTGSGDSDDITCIRSVPGTGADLGLPYETMYPLPLPQLEKRPVLGRSSSSSLSTVHMDSHDLVAVNRKYSRDFLLECALSPHSKVLPPNWDQITIECPAIIKKGSSSFDLKVFAKQASTGSEASIISYNQLITSEPESD